VQPKSSSTSVSAHGPEAVGHQHHAQQEQPNATEQQNNHAHILFWFDSTDPNASTP